MFLNSWVFLQEPNKFNYSVSILSKGLHILIDCSQLSKCYSPNRQYTVCVVHDDLGQNNRTTHSVVPPAIIAHCLPCHWLSSDFLSFIVVKHIWFFQWNPSIFILTVNTPVSHSHYHLITQTTAVKTDWHSANNTLWTTDIWHMTEVQYHTFKPTYFSKIPQVKSCSTYTSLEESLQIAQSKRF